MDDKKRDQAICGLLDNKEFIDNICFYAAHDPGMERDAHRNMAREMLTDLVEKLLDDLYAELVVR